MDDSMLLQMQMNRLLIAMYTASSPQEIEMITDKLKKLDKDIELHLLQHLNAQTYQTEKATEEQTGG